jgi:ABC-type transport system involved in multi-copper enzyme maturation permease subunit
MLVGPVFSAGSVTSERERQTLELLLTTIISPGKILWGKLVSGLRVSSVLTMFLVWPLLLACVMVSDYWGNLISVLGYIVIVLVTCLTTATVALFCSVFFRKTSVALMTAYLVVVVLFALPLAAKYFADVFFAGTPTQELAQKATFISPIGAAFALPLELARGDAGSNPGDWPVFLSFLLFYGVLNAAMLSTMSWLFHTRWRVAY